MAEVNITLHGRNYGIACDDGQEERVRSLGAYINERLSDIAKAAPSASEPHLLVLTSLVITDELFEFLDSDNAGAGNNSDSEEAALVVNSLADKLENIAQKLDKVA